MNGIKRFILIPLLLIPVVVTANQIFIKIQSFTIYDINRDYIHLEFFGPSEINIVVVRSDPNINVEIFKQMNNGTSGYAKIYLTNTSRQSLTCIIGMFSHEPFSINILARTIGTTIQQPQIISVPGNITLQIEIPIVYGRYQQPIETKSEAKYSPSFPLWAIISYGVIIPMFLATAHLDKGSLKLLKKRWSQLDMFALILRYLFYAFLVLFFIFTMAIIVEFIMVRMGIIFTLHIGDWLLTCAIFSAIALLYGIGKWRGLFENLDEEE